LLVANKNILVPEREPAPFSSISCSFKHTPVFFKTYLLYLEWWNIFPRGKGQPIFLLYSLPPWLTGLFVSWFLQTYGIFFFFTAMDHGGKCCVSKWRRPPKNTRFNILYLRLSSSGLSFSRVCSLSSFLHGCLNEFAVEDTFLIFLLPPLVCSNFLISLSCFFFFFLYVIFSFFLSLLFILIN